MKSIIKFSAFCFLFLIFSCATIIMPSGGPRDIIPPKVLKTYPENNTSNFSDNKLIIYFDEFIEFNQPLTNISVSPFSKIKPKTSIVGKKVYLEFTEGLKSNTTYSIEFNNAIKDFSEGNNLSSFSLAFSTGSRLDTGKLIVKVSDAKDMKHSDMTKICLVKNKSDFFGKNYSYVTTANSGKAQFPNLSEDSFYIYAFVDSNLNMTWDKAEAIAFNKYLVKAGQAEIDLRLFNQKQIKPNFIVTPKNNNEFDIFSSDELSFPEVEDANFILMSIGPKQVKIIAKSSIHPQKLRLKYNGDKYENIELPATKHGKYIETINLGSRMLQAFRNDTLTIVFNGFLTKLDTSKIKLKADDKSIKANFSIQKNQLIITGLDFGKSYKLSLDSQALWSHNLFNTSFIQDFTTFPKDKFFENLIITLDPSIAMNKSAKIFQFKENHWYPLEKQAKTIFNKEYGDEMKFYILIDTNNDGMWSTGDVNKEIQPEKLYLETIKLEPKKTNYILKISTP